MTCIVYTKTQQFAYHKVGIIQDNIKLLSSADCWHNEIRHTTPKHAIINSIAIQFPCNWISGAGGREGRTLGAPGNGFNQFPKRGFANVPACLLN